MYPRANNNVYTSSGANGLLIIHLGLVKLYMRLGLVVLAIGLNLGNASDLINEMNFFECNCGERRDD